MAAEEWRVRLHAPIREVGDAPPEDGYKWRKYGQKALTGTAFTRGYYRCNKRELFGCRVTKQVQRLVENPSIVEVTYHGHHTCDFPSLTPPVQRAATLEIPPAIAVPEDDLEMPPEIAAPPEDDLEIPPEIAATEDDNAAGKGACLLYYGVGVRYGLVQDISEDVAKTNATPDLNKIALPDLNEPPPPGCF